MNIFSRLCWLLVAVMAGHRPPAVAQETYPRAGWETDLYRFIPALNVRGMATILDERTIQLTHFSYDGSAPGIYGHLGTNNTAEAFENGPRIGPEFVRAYNDETVILQLPEGQTLDGYAAFSIWCEPVKVNLGSGVLQPPVRPTLSVSPIGSDYLEIKIVGTPRRTYWLQSCTGPLETSAWKNLYRFTNTTGVTFVYEPMSPTNRFYRAVRD